MGLFQTIKPTWSHFIQRENNKQQINLLKVLILFLLIFDFKMNSLTQISLNDRKEMKQ